MNSDSKSTEFPQLKFDIESTKASNDSNNSSTLNVTYIPSETKHLERHSVHWFRKGLRLHDNPSLYEGLKGSVTFRCIFLLDPWFAGSSNVGINKWRFLLQCLEDLDSSLRKINSRLFVLRGQPNDIFPKIFEEWGTTCFTFEEDPEPFGKMRDCQIVKLCRKQNIEVIQVVSHTLYKLEKIMEKNGNRTPLTYNQFQSIIEKMGPPPNASNGIELLQTVTTPINDADHDERFGVPTLHQLGYETDNLKPPVWVGGETEALANLERHLERKAWVASFGKPKMTPQSLLASQTGLSPYLRFGCLSVRLFYHQLSDLYRKIKKSEPPLSLHGQLLWREFFFCAAAKNWNFDKMKSNPICIQIPWSKNPEALAKWANGQTGFPWIDAIMIQLREEGWIHHLARHAVICFLTRGDLWISWEEGAKVFEDLLLDGDWSVNAGMWMWLSSSSFFQQFFHCYCPVRFGRRADPNGEYIRRYLPILEKFPIQYIHEPWMAPKEVQIAAKCLIGRDYPVPMVDHSAVSRINTERLRQVYQHLYKQHGKSGNINTKEISLNTVMTKQEVNNFPGSANILILKTNEIQANLSTSNANSKSNTSAQIPCYRSDNDQRNPTNNNLSHAYRPIRNVRRLKTRNSNQLYERPSNNNQNSQQSQYPVKSFNTQQTNAHLKQCRYQSNPIYKSSFSDQNYNSSESSFCDESASDSKLIAYNRISSQRMINLGENGSSMDKYAGYDNHVNVLQDYNNHSMIATNTQQSYGNCPNDFNNPNSSSQIVLMTFYQPNENAASQQQNYSTDYQNYENK